MFRIFSAPKEARRFFVQLLSLDKEPVMFANVSIVSRPGLDKGEIPFEVKALPAEKNVWWNGGKVKTLNFSDAPGTATLPACVDLETGAPAGGETVIPARHALVFRQTLPGGQAHVNTVPDT